MSATTPGVIRSKFRSEKWSVSFVAVARSSSAVCQTALNIDPGSASNFDPLDGYGGTPLISPAK
ncbi:hypothetical protein, partial [Methylobacterium brachiatum]|uniref:hypothetical protein n=1 Tax=Methylobacterium brachiatum TaxID=269660 RepID=UPI0027D844A2